MYIYDPSKGNARSRAIFTQEDARRFDFSAEDFPAQEAACGRSSPTHVSGRVVSRTPRSSFGAITRDVTMADLEDRELMVGGSDGPSKLDYARGNSLFRPHESSFQTATATVSSAELTELDFDSFENLAVNSEGTGNYQDNKNQTVIFTGVPKAPIFSRRKMDFLRRGVVLGSNCPPQMKKEFLLPQKDSTDIEVLSKGRKRPSSLGLEFINNKKPFKDFTGGASFNAFLQKMFSVMIRTRTTELCSYISARKQVKPFTFDIPEPTTFERRQDVTMRSSTRTPLPAPRRRKQVSAPASEKTQDNADLSLHPEPPGLAEALSKKLDLSAQSKVASTRSAPTSAVSSSPSKPIDRKLLLNEYLNQRKVTGDKEIVNLIVVGKHFK
ncbi:unnamed protein product [Calicophoron daubneyi]|uniref:Uncharacterized protein n=1 Tax=Calicophoron daubneyi TaxID=300641 RepID=A0AAV2TAH2_CALDB